MICSGRREKTSPKIQTKNDFRIFCYKLTFKKNYDKIIIYRKELFPITNYGTIKTLDDFPTIAEVGDIIYCEETHQIYTYYDEGLGKPFGWKETEIDKTGLLNLGLTEYDINKMIIGQLPSLITEAQLEPSKKLLYEFTHNHITSVGYYMLLCNDIHYYTVFEVCNEYEEKVENLIIECLQNVGVIQQINRAENESAIECWVKNENGVFMFMLFNYDWGVITCQ